MTIKNKNLFIKIYLVLYPLICGVITFVNFGVKIISPVLDISLIIMFCILSVIYILLLYIYRRNLKVYEKIFYYSLYIVFIILMLKIRYCWIIILLLAPLNYLLHKNKSEVRVIITLAISLFIIFIYCFIAFLNWIGSFGESIGNVQEYHHYSPDKKYVAVEYLNNSGALGGDEWVTLYKNTSPYFLRKVSRIYMNFNWQEDLDVKWIDNKTVYIEGCYFDIDNLEKVIINTHSYD